MTSPKISAPRPTVKVDVQLLGRPYSVACEAGEEKRLESLAGYLDSKLRQLSGSISSATEARLFMLAALMLADEVFELKSGGQQSVPNHDSAQEATYVAAVEHLNERLLKIAARLQRA